MSQFYLNLLVMSLTTDLLYKCVTALRYIQSAPAYCMIMLCANKIDLPEEEWTVRREEYEAFARENGYNLMEASARSGIHVQEMFVELGRQVLQNNRHELAEVDDKDRASRGDGESLILFDFNERERRRKEREANRKCCIIS